MTKVTTDRDIIRGENVSTPTYVALDSSNQTINTTWSDISIIPQEGDFENDEFPYDVWMGDRLSPDANQVGNRDFHFRVDLAVQTPLLLPKQLHFRLVPFLVSDDTQNPAFGMLTVDIDAILLLTINAANPYNLMYQLSPFFVQPTQYYKLQAKTNIGSVVLTQRAVSITRNS